MNRNKGRASINASTLANLVSFSLLLLGTSTLQATDRPPRPNVVVILFDHIMAIYAAVVAHMDNAVGRFVDALRGRKLLDNTLIFFLSDNGANAESGPNGRLDGKEPGATQSVVFEGQSWATLSNTPLRRYKHFNHEGGIATPLIVHWPQRVKTPGELRKQPGHVVDIMATCVDVAGAKYPAEFHGQPIQPMEGKRKDTRFFDKYNDGAPDCCARPRTIVDLLAKESHRQRTELEDTLS